MKTKTWWGAALMLVMYGGCIAAGIAAFVFPFRPGAETVQVILGTLMIGTGIFGPVFYLFTGEFPMGYEDF